MAATKKRPVGRPFLLDRVVHPATEERPAITTADLIVGGFRSGLANEVTAGYAGIAKSTLQDYLRTGARVSASLTAGATQPDDHTHIERACAELSDRVTRASAEFERSVLSNVDQRVAGGIPEVVVTTEYEVKRDSEGHPVIDERTGEPVMVEVARKVRESKTLPDGHLGLKRLVMRHPERYAMNRHLHEHFVAEGPAPVADEDLGQIALDALHSWPPLDPIETTGEDLTAREGL